MTHKQELNARDGKDVSKVGIFEACFSIDCPFIVGETALQVVQFDRMKAHQMNAVFRITSIFALVAGVFTLASCGMGQPEIPPRASHVMFQWYPDSGTGKVRVSIDLSKQIATVYRGNQEIGWTFVATGKEGKGTPGGNYRITEKIIDKHSNLYGWIENEFGEVTSGDATPKDELYPGEVYKPAPMPYWMRLTDYGIGMHQGNIPKPGETASHGCIRMPEEFVPILFEKVKIGTPVRIKY